MARDFKQFPKDIAAKLEKVGFREACLIVDTILEEMDPTIPVETWRLIDSGFGYVNGQLVNVTDQGRSHNRLDVMPPDVLPVRKGTEKQYDILISYHTPKPVGRNATKFKMYHGQPVFDYAPKMLESDADDYMYRQASFSSHRKAALKSMAKKVGSSFTKTQLNAAIKRALQKGISKVGSRIVMELS